MRWVLSIAVVLIPALTGCSLILSDGDPGDDTVDAGTDPRTDSISLTSDVVEVLDTWIWEGIPDEQHGADGILVWDTDRGDPPNVGAAATLLRFELAPGDSGELIPSDATVVSATLFMTVVDNGDNARLSMMNVAWDEGTTWSTIGASFGLVPGEDFDPTPVGQITAMAEGLRPGADVTESVLAWLSGTENNGWVVTADRSNGVEVYSSESEFAELRPELVVEFTSGPGSD